MADCKTKCHWYEVKCVLYSAWRVLNRSEKIKFTANCFVSIPEMYIYRVSNDTFTFKKSFV